MEIADNQGLLESIRCSISLDIFRCVLIFLTYFGHNLGTVKKAYFEISGYYGDDEIKAQGPIMRTNVDLIINFRRIAT